MGNPAPDTRTPAVVAFIMVTVGILIAATHGLLQGSIAGGVISALGAIPACYGMWKGIQQQTQGTLALSVAALLIALAVGGILVVLGIISLLR